MRVFRPLALAAAGAAALTAWLFWPGPAVEINIPPGQAARQTAVALRDAGVVRSALMFRVWMRLGGVERRLKPGSYRLRARMLPWRLAATLASGGGGIRVVIPEGWSAKQIAELLQSGGVCPADAFLRLVRRDALEGYLFPATYNFEPDSDAARVAGRMRAEFERRGAVEFAKVRSKPRLTLHQVLTLASIVEREAVRKYEQPLIAAVYLNRLRLRMRLQADPTVQYALGYWKKGLTFRDLQTPSPYNTYVHYGLPPGPICNPGLGAVRAVLHPAVTEDLYFVADHEGGHVFAATPEEHLKAKKDFKRALRAEKKLLRERKDFQ